MLVQSRMALVQLIAKIHVIYRFGDFEHHHRTDILLQERNADIFDEIFGLNAW